MSCHPLEGLKLDKESKTALERISNNQNLAKLLSVGFTAGVFHSIFTKNKSPVVALNITQSDWSLYAKTMSALPKIQRDVIQKEINMMIVHYHIGKYDHKHVQFWKGMKHGCR